MIRIFNHEDAQAYHDTEMFRLLANLAFFELVVTDVYPTTIVEVVVSLRSIETVSVCLPMFSYQTASLAIQNASPTLEELTIDTQNPELIWTAEENWTFVKLCEARNVDLTLNGYGQHFFEEGKLEFYLTLTSEDVHLH